MANPGHLQPSADPAGSERTATAKGMLDVARIAREAIREVDLERVLRSITEQGVALGAISSALFRYDEERNCLRREAAWMMPEGLAETTETLPIDAPNLLVVRAIRSGMVQVVEDVAEVEPELALARRWMEGVGGRSMVVIPLISRDTTIGVLAWIFANPQRLSDREREAYRSLGEFFALAILNAQAREQLLREIETRKRAERERERLLAMVEKERVWLRFMIERSPVAVVMMRPGGQVLSNAEAERLLGRPIDPHGGLEQFAGMVRLPNGRILGKGRELGWELATGPLFVNSEATILRDDGEEIPVFGTLGYVHDDRGRLVGGVGILQDMRPIKELERLRQEWTSVVAHDLRQPATVIHTYASLLVRGDLDEKSRDRVQHILSSTRQLERMITDLLDASLLEARHLKLECRPTFLDKLCETLTEKLAEEVHDREMRLRVEGEPFPVEVDASRIEQLATNLLSNAIKYGYPDSPIEIRLAYADDHVEVSFTNHGEGIPPQQIPTLFDRFSGGTRARGSVGLGLYIARGIAEAHGGKIWVKSTPRQTTTFYVRLPKFHREGC